MPPFVNSVGYLSPAASVGQLKSDNPMLPYTVILGIAILLFLQAAREVKLKGGVFPGGMSNRQQLPWEKMGGMISYSPTGALRGFDLNGGTVPRMAPWSWAR
ncbi:hypothetical protein MMC29_004157 [Sticta canariensis]|nr:hypothetical protein [Sticta canariensis]